jgi:hypothetical protein
MRTMHIDLPLHRVVLTDVSASNGGNLDGSCRLSTRFPARA